LVVLTKQISVEFNRGGQGSCHRWMGVTARKTPLVGDSEELVLGGWMGRRVDGWVK
jgi:hypothetical protein